MRAIKSARLAPVSAAKAVGRRQTGPASVPVCALTATTDDALDSPVAGGIKVKVVGKTN
jgi:hypothetical protein